MEAVNVTHFTKFIECAVVLRDIVCFEPFNGVFVVHSSEGSFGWHKVWIEFFDEMAEWRFKHTVNHIAYQVFQSIEQFIECNEWTFGFDVTVLRQVPASSTRLSTITLSNAVYVT